MERDDDGATGAGASALDDALGSARWDGPVSARPDSKVSGVEVWIVAPEFAGLAPKQPGSVAAQVANRHHAVGKDALLAHAPTDPGEHDRKRRVERGVGDGLRAGGCGGASPLALKLIRRQCQTDAASGGQCQPLRAGQVAASLLHDLCERWRDKDLDDLPPLRASVGMHLALERLLVRLFRLGFSCHLGSLPASSRKSHCD
ncbi:hypothetical protein [Azospirillum sp. sgz302134]